MTTISESLVGVTKQLEQASSLDGLRRGYAALAAPLDRWSGSGLLRSRVLGHALHPLLTDVPLGCWTAASILDASGRAEYRGASRLLIGVGLAAVGPTAITGLAEWARTGPEIQRVGAVHGALNSGASLLYLTSFVARGRGRHGLGVVAALAGASVAGVSGYLGGHLTIARKVGSRDPAFAED